MRSALDRLSRIPAEDLAALRKMWSGDLPEPRPIGRRPVLLVVDMTEAFVRDRYPTGWAATGEPCAAGLAGLLGEARAAGVPVVYTVTEPLPHPAQVGAWLRGRPGPSMFPFDAPGPHHEVVPEVAPVDGDIVMVKPKPSAFFGTQLHAVLNALRADTVVVTGMTTSGCVRATVNDAFMLNFPVVVPLECVADRSQLSHEVELFDMGAKYADVVLTDDLRAALRTPERVPA
ncbi:isochorismatase family protein [Geodermatophilus sp. DSM 44513]|uniref:isochorismatase family protein n=1 Tax=Geodermatophilus sp. DSM 44513 TaxID=1528104 RepID=UPI00126AA5B4|nr:isochorismatase family protein [Geodermatophilus sp. DSM 44513]WNV77844.1 isochorismatase family protein [Geodermatophilus sp. DSM 44513]